MEVLKHIHKTQNMKKKVALLAGGYTGESVVSMKSAAMVAKSLENTSYEVFNIIINQEKWVYVNSQNEEFPIDKNDFTANVEGVKISFDVVFICIHGSPGEDGKLQGYLDMIGLPYTTCDAITSAITMNKAYTKSVIADLKDVSVAKSMQVFANRPSSSEAILKQLTLPLFVKPNFGGSSIGMSRVNVADELAPAIAKAFLEDDQLIIEEFISGREFTIGVVRLNGKIWVLPATEVISSKEFFDFEAKYTTGLTEEITPGRMTAEEVDKVQQMASAIYERLNCAGVVRIDYIINESGKVYVLEINTVPGQSENSIIPQQVRATGMEMSNFYSLLIEEALK